jgi:YgiT-type zinc finger domain-containing protein
VKCPICKHGDRVPGTATVALTRDRLTLVVTGVPALVCTTCGEEYVTEAATEHLLHTAEDALRAGVQLEVRQYAA